MGEKSREHQIQSGAQRGPPVDVTMLSPSVDDFTMVADNEYGWVPLLERIAQRYGVAPANVVLAHGTSMANHLACAALVEAGSRGDRATGVRSARRRAAISRL